MMRSKANPFSRSPYYWKVLFTLPGEAVGTAEQSFDDIALAVSAFETDEKNHIWTFELLFEEKPDEDEIRRRMYVLSTLHNITIPDITLQELPEEDWLSKVAQSFPPITIGRFFVHGAHVTEVAPVGAITIQVDAGAAFGSGEHGTTRCCLQALDWLARQRKFRRILDMGCGSGILAIAAAKLWRTDIIAVDIDPVAVKITQSNIRKNQVQPWVTADVSDGYASDVIKRSPSFDLIISNILARPLIAFAPDLAKSLSDDGLAVLSGLLVSQEKQVLSAHLAQGLKLQKRFVHQEWCTLVLKR